MDQTDIWMLGVVAFGLVFYLFALHFHRTRDYHRHNDRDKCDQAAEQPVREP